MMALSYGECFVSEGPSETGSCVWHFHAICLAVDEAVLDLKVTALNEHHNYGYNSCFGFVNIQRVRGKDRHESP